KSPLPMTAAVAMKCRATVDTIVGRIAALRFFFVKVLRRPYRDIDLVYPKRPERLPVILSEEEVARLIESAATSYHRVILMILYGAGLMREELCRLKVTDVDCAAKKRPNRKVGPVTLGNSGTSLRSSLAQTRRC